MAPWQSICWRFGARSLSRRPQLISGTRDIAELALAVSGLIVVGPMKLFFPLEAAIWFGWCVWLLLLGLYAACVLLWLLSSRPRLVIYNMSIDELRPILADAAAALDADARWAGDSLAMPKLGVQLYCDRFALLRGVSLIAAGGRQSQLGWRRLAASLGGAIARRESARNPYGLFFLVAGLACVAVISRAVAQNPLAVAESLQDFIQTWRNLLGQ